MATILVRFAAVLWHVAELVTAAIAVVIVTIMLAVLLGFVALFAALLGSAVADPECRFVVSQVRAVCRTGGHVLLPTRGLDGGPGTFPAGRPASGGAFLPLAATGFGRGGDHLARLAGSSSLPAGVLPAALPAGRGDDPHLRQSREAAEREAEPVGGIGAPPGLVVVMHP